MFASQRRADSSPEAPVVAESGRGEPSDEDAPPLEPFGGRGAGCLCRVMCAVNTRRGHPRDTRTVGR
jgi:hypothetical protein